MKGVDYIDPEMPHCVTTMFSASDIENAADTTMKSAVCFATEREAMLAARWVDTRRLAGSERISDKPNLLTRSSSFSFQAIAKHCDGYCHVTTATLTINGTACTGGGLTFSTAWRNRISDNQHKKCGEIRLYPFNAYGGTATVLNGDYNDFSPVAGSPIDNDANSARYYGPVN